MFGTTQGTARGRALGRVALGLTLLVGGGAMFENALLREHGASSIPTWQVIAAAWLAALLANQLVRLFVRDGANASPRLLAWSFVVPGLGFAAIAPLTVQTGPVLLFMSERDYEAWICLALVCTGIAHVVYAGLLAARGRALVLGRPVGSIFSLYWTVVIVSAIPFVALLGIPPLLTGITGLVLVPVTRWTDRLAIAERTAAAMEPPTARVV